MEKRLKHIYFTDIGWRKKYYIGEFGKFYDLRHLASTKGSLSTPRVDAGCSIAVGPQGELTVYAGRAVALSGAFGNSRGYATGLWWGLRGTHCSLPAGGGRAAVLSGAFGNSP